MADLKCNKIIHGYSKKQIIICGIESAVCILQTVIDLLANKFDVYVVSNAIGSRHEFDHDIALKRMSANGANIITKEMVFFEWLRSADHPQFKTLSKKYLQ